MKSGFLLPIVPLIMFLSVFDFSESHLTSTDISRLAWIPTSLGHAPVEDRHFGVDPESESHLGQANEGTSQASQSSSTTPELEGFVLIRAGTFIMGSPEDELGRGFDEEAAHRVTITRDFYLQATEVTQSQWREVMGNNPSRFTACGDDCPVDTVSWWDAVTYLNVLSSREGLDQCYILTNCRGTPGTTEYYCREVEFRGLLCNGYRLPTEAEWEYAARAGTNTAYYSGPNTEEYCRLDANLDVIGWYCGNSEVDYPGCHGMLLFNPSYCGGTHPVGQKQANAWGLYDMLGNVEEWTLDQWSNYEVNPVVDPIGTSYHNDRMLRGGGWMSDASSVRAAYRVHSGPNAHVPHIGFRAARSAP